VREGCRRGEGREGAEVEVGCGALDLGEDEVVLGGGVLFTSGLNLVLGVGVGERGRTRFELYSIHMEFLLGLVMRAPATVGTMSEGGMWRRPGPRRRGCFGLEGLRAGSIVSPGRTTGWADAMVGGFLSESLVFPLGLLWREENRW
jgi:hypothetical protein